MTVDDLKNHYGVKSDAELARKLKHTRGAICKWRHRGIPIESILRVRNLKRLQLKER